MLWDFAKGAILGRSRLVIRRCTLNGGPRLLQAWPGSGSGQVQIADACDQPLPDETRCVWFTDPPYYDAVPYADLSDFFFVWLNRVLPVNPLLRDPFDPATF